MLRIPAVLMEEHRDAYYHWHRMIDMGVIPPTGNYLLHIDHHDDMECPGYDWDLTPPFTELRGRVICRQLPQNKMIVYLIV